MQHGHPVGQHDRLVEIVGHKDDRNVEPAAQLGDLTIKALPGRLVDGRKRLIEEQDLGLTSQRSRQSNALLLASRQLRRAALLQTGKVHHFEKASGPLLPIFRRHVPQGRHDIAERRHVRKQSIALEDHADGSAVRRQVNAAGGGEPCFAVHSDAAVLRPIGARDAPQDCRFAAARRPHQRQHLAGRAGERGRKRDGPVLADIHLQSVHNVHPSRRPTRRDKV